MVDVTINNVTCSTLQSPPPLSLSLSLSLSPVIPSLIHLDKLAFSSVPLVRCCGMGPGLGHRSTLEYQMSVPVGTLLLLVSKLTEMGNGSFVEEIWL